MNPFSPGRHRPIYLWAGPGTMRMNRLKFMNTPVDETVHLEAHTSRGASIVADETGLNWAYLMFDWGFPPEAAAEDFASFQQAVQAYHARGIKVFAYIQTSNYVHQGSFREKDWYALDPAGAKIHYYTGRYMACWKHPQWIAHLEQLVQSAIETGADGVFFDNPWYGGQPLNLDSLWLGSIGCYCPRCREAYRSDTSRDIPTTFYSIKEEQAVYLRWRANQVTASLRHLAEFARHLRPDIVISVNDFDAVMRNSFLVFGIDLPALAQIQDVMMIEDYGLPRYQVGKRIQWVNNVLTLHTAAALCAPTPVTVDPYDRGIGFDSVFPARRYLQGMAEAAACGASMVIKGTEFVDEGKFTLLTAPQFKDTRLQIKKYHDWLAAHHTLFDQRANLARVGVVYPGDSLWKNWFSVAPCYFGVGQSLLAMGIPWRVVTQPDDLAGLECLITCDHLFKPDWPLPDHLKVIALSALPGWTKFTPFTLPKKPTYLNALSGVLHWLYNQYFESRIIRSMLDGIGIMRMFTQSPHFYLPEQAPRDRLAAELPVTSLLKSASVPVLVETWQNGSALQYHLVNYADKPTIIQIQFEGTVRGRCISPDRAEEIEIHGDAVSLPLDIYNLIILEG